MIDIEAIQEQLSHLKSFVLFNRTMTPEAKLADIPAAILDRLNGEKPHILVASRDEIDRISIVLSHDQLARFQKGEPIFINANAVAHRPALKKGRRQIEGIERRVKDAHAVQTYIGIERLCEWLHAGKSSLPKIPDQRLKAMRLLATDGLMDDTTIDATEEADRLAFYRTQCDAGSRLITKWHPWIENPRQLLEEARKVVRMSLSSKKPAAIKEEIEKEMVMNRCLLRCWRQATTLVLTENKMSDQVRKRDRETRGQLAVLAGIGADRPALDDLVRAALDGDFNPSDLYRNLKYLETLFELARVLGRHGRGSDEQLERPLAREMRHQISFRDLIDERIEDNPESVQNDEYAAAQVLTQTAYELFPKRKWIDVLDAAIEAKDTVTLTGRSGRVAA